MTASGLRGLPRAMLSSAIDVDGKALLPQPELVARAQLGRVLRHERRFERDHQRVDAQLSSGPMASARPSDRAEAGSDAARDPSP